MRCPKLRGLLRSLLLAAGLASATPLLAGPQDLPDLTGNAFLSSSDRMRIRAFGAGLEAGNLSPAAVAFLRRDLLAQGYGVTPGQLQVTARRLSFAPVLGWDGNINGGVLQDRLDLGGYVLEADPAFRAKAGLVLGSSLAAMTRLAWGEGRVFELALSSELAWSPRHEIGRADLALNLCSRNHLQNWTFLDLCALGSRSWRQLDTGNAHRLSLGLSKIFAAAGGLQELGLRFDRASASGGPQDRLRLSAERISRAGVLDLALTLGEGREDETLLRRRIEAGFAWQTLGRDWRFDLWQQVAEGGAFLGRPRRDQLRGLGLMVSLKPGVSLRIGASSSRSTAQIANYDQLSLDLRFGDLLR